MMHPTRIVWNETISGDLRKTRTCLGFWEKKERKKITIRPGVLGVCCVERLVQRGN